jgi:hypothetical protein
MRVKSDAVAARLSTVLELVIPIVDGGTAQLQLQFAQPKEALIAVASPSALRQPRDDGLLAFSVRGGPIFLGVRLGPRVDTGSPLVTIPPL